MKTEVRQNTDVYLRDEHNVYLQYILGFYQRVGKTSLLVHSFPPSLFCEGLVDFCKKLLFVDKENFSPHPLAYLPLSFSLFAWDKLVAKKFNFVFEVLIKHL